MSVGSIPKPKKQASRKVYSMYTVLSRDLCHSLAVGVTIFVRGKVDFLTRIHQKQILVKQFSCTLVSSNRRELPFPIVICSHKHSVGTHTAGNHHSTERENGCLGNCWDKALSSRLNSIMCVCIVYVETKPHRYLACALSVLSIFLQATLCITIF